MTSLRARLETRPPRNGSFYTVAIDGRGGSGKTTLAACVRDWLPDFFVLNGDDYFEPIDHPVSWGDFNEERFAAEVIAPLKAGNSFVHRPYRWGEEPPVTDHPVTVEHGIAIERCFVMAYDLDWDLTIWVDTPREVCLQRGIDRDLVGHEQLLATWRDLWQPNEDRFIAEHDPLRRAGLVVDGTRPYDAQL